MPHITIANAQQWLQPTKAKITQLDAELELTAAETVLSRLRSTYDVDGWLDEESTPSLVRSVIGMLYAAWFYDLTYAEDLDGESTYGAKLESSAYTLLGSLADGSILLDSDTVPRESFVYPAFWPNDVATQIATDEGPEADGAAPLAFTMGKVF